MVSQTYSESPGTIRKEGRCLSTIEEWGKHAPPKRKEHWKDGRSAKESARSWIRAAPFVPTEISETLYSASDIGTLSYWCAEPEAKVRFDAFRGEPANIDVLLTGQDENGPIVVTVEAKADEVFGNTIEKTLLAAKRRLQRNTESRGVERVEQLLAALFGATIDQHEILHLRYQLMTLTAGALAEAERSKAHRAVVIIHEFVTPLTIEKNHAQNRCDLETFLARIAGQHCSLESGQLIGPFRVPGEPILRPEISLYFGKALVVSNNSNVRSAL